MDDNPEFRIVSIKEVGIDTTELGLEAGDPVQILYDPSGVRVNESGLLPGLMWRADCYHWPKLDGPIGESGQIERLKEQTMKEAENPGLYASMIQRVDVSAYLTETRELGRVAPYVRFAEFPPEVDSFADNRSHLSVNVDLSQEAIQALADKGPYYRDFTHYWPIPTGDIVWEPEPGPFRTYYFPPDFDADEDLS